MMRVSVRAALLPVVALLAVPSVAADDEPDIALPRLEAVGEVRIDMPNGVTEMLAVPSPSGRHLAVCYAPYSNQPRQADSWTSLRLIDVRKAHVEGSWDDLMMGGLPPAFSPEGALIAFGSRKDSKTLTVHVTACATGHGPSTDVPHREGARGFASVCGVSSNGERVAIREPEDAGGAHRLMVQELSGKRTIARFEHVVGTSERDANAGVTLTGPLVAFHESTSNEDGSTGYRLNVVELDTSRSVAQRPAFASRTTSRHALTRDKSRLINGTREFAVEVVALPSGEVTPLFDAKDLYSHYLEVVLSGNGKRAVAWSDERKLLLARDLDGGDAIRVELDFRAHVVGVSHDGRWVFVRVTGKGLMAVDLDAGTTAGVVTPDLANWVRMAPDGTHLIGGTRDDEGWTFEFFAVKTP